jgi:hypothetical protein
LQRPIRTDKLMHADQRHHHGVLIDRVFLIADRPLSIVVENELEEVGVAFCYLLT